MIQKEAERFYFIEKIVKIQAPLNFKMGGLVHKYFACKREKMYCAGLNVSLHLFIEAYPYSEREQKLKKKKKRKDQ